MDAGCVRTIRTGADTKFCWQEKTTEQKADTRKKRKVRTEMLVRENACLEKILSFKMIERTHEGGFKTTRLELGFVHYHQPLLDFIDAYFAV